MIDYHIHTARCGHAGGAVADFVGHAKSVGLDEIGFADHLPLFHTFDASLAMSWDDLPLYLADIKKLRESVDSPRIKLGIEADYIPKFADQTRAILADYDFDYVLGSVHFIDGWGFDDRRYIDNYNAFELADLYERYFSLFVEAAKSGMFHVMAHPDLIKKYFQLDPEPVSLYEDVVRELAGAGVAIEVSSAGLRKPCREIYPGRAFLEICARYGIPVALGSDAHAPDQVGQDFELLALELSAVGYTEIAAFTAGVRTMVDLG